MFCSQLRELQVCGSPVHPQQHPARGLRDLTRAARRGGWTGRWVLLRLAWALGRTVYVTNTHFTRGGLFAWAWGHHPNPPHGFRVEARAEAGMTGTRRRM